MITLLLLVIVALALILVIGACLALMPVWLVVLIFAPLILADAVVFWALNRRNKLKKGE